MKKIRLLIMALAIAGMAGVYSCGQSQDRPGKAGDAPEMEETEQSDEEKTEEMIEQAEEMEGDTTED